MSLKAMIFIDGSWLYKSRQVLFDTLDAESGFEIDYKRIPDIIAQELAESLGLNVDMVRTNYFGTIPVNKQGYNPVKQRSFYEFLSIQCGYDVDITEIDFRKEPEAHPDEKWVNVGLSVSMMHYAMQPGAFDVAVLVGGDPDYVPLLRKIRLMGKRVFLVAMNPMQSKAISSPTLLTTPGVFDFPPLYMDEHAEVFRLNREEQNRVCKKCGAEELTTWAGLDFYCSQCRSEYRKQTRICDNCGKEEETTWDKSFFYCSDCRKNHRMREG